MVFYEQTINKKNHKIHKKELANRVIFFHWPETLTPSQVFPVNSAKVFNTVIPWNTCELLQVQIVKVQ